MKYANGKNVRVGDQIQIGSDVFGEIVAIIDDGKFAPGFPREEWNYLKCGVLIKSPQMGIVHEKEFDEGVKLISRNE